jgi:hypothetical protein
MEPYLAPAVVIALIGIVVQGIKAILDIIDRAKARRIGERQRKISLCVALMSMINEMSLSDGKKVEYKEKLIKHLLSDMLTEDLVLLLDLPK